MLFLEKKRLRIAIQDSFPNLPITSEKEFIRRAIIALGSLGHQAVSVETSDEIIAYRPDVVLVTHFCTPKLTAFPTVGLMWSPPSFYAKIQSFYRNILSYDGYLSGSRQVTQFLSDLLFAANKKAPVSEYMYPSCMTTPFVEESPSTVSLFYAGVNWDNERYIDLFRILDKDVSLHLFGPPKGWRGLKNSYRGTLPVDGIAVLETIRKHGAALCIHRPEFRAANTPSSRLFETAAAGAVIIGDEFDFTKEHFAGAMLFIDPEQSPPEIAKQIKDHLTWINSHREAAREMARRSYNIFVEKFCLEKLFANIGSLVDEIREASLICPKATTERLGTEGPLVQYIIRVGCRPVTVINRCLESLAQQTYNRIGIIIVQFAEVSGLMKLLNSYESRFESIEMIRTQGSGSLRSNSLWKGLRAVRAPYFGILDDDDSLHPNHVATLVEKLLENKSYRFAYSGAIQAEDDDGIYLDARNFHVGSETRTIKERRSLRHLEPYNKAKLLRLENYIASNAWLASRELLDSRVLTDPDLSVGEDFYLCLMFLQRTEFVPTWKPTAVYHFRSTSKDNSVLNRDLWRHWDERIRLRTHLDFGRPLADLQLTEESGLELKVLRGIRRFLQGRNIRQLMGKAAKTFRERGVSGLLEVLSRKGS